MELTTSYQKLGEAYLGSSAGNLYIRVYAKYSEQDVSNNRTKVQYQARAYFSGNYIYDERSYGNVKGTSASQVNYSRSSSYDNGETTLETTEAWVTHNADGTMSVSASAYLNFPNWGWNATASGTATLPNLHKPPVLLTAEVTERNTTLTGLGIPDTTAVRYLSNKRFTLHGTPYDGATLSYQVIGFRYNSGVQASNVIDVNFATDAQYVVFNEGLNRVEISQVLTDNMNGKTTGDINVLINSVASPLNMIAYSKPAFERTSTNIKRKSGGGVNLTDNKASLNLKATYYKNNDAIGNYNNIQQIGYKIWATDASEPSSYTTLTPTISGGNITINNLEISNVLFTKAYNYKIIVKDRFNNQDLIDDGRIPMGVSLWTEYKDRVDFYKITQKGNDVLTVGDILYEGALLGATSTSIDMTGYSKLRIYAVSYSTQFFFDLDLTEAVPVPLTSGRSYVASGVGSYYSTSQSALEYHMCCVEVNDAKTTLYNTNMGYLRGSTTNLRNNSSNYYIYKIEGYK